MLSHTRSSGNGIGAWSLERVRVHSLQSVRGSTMGHCPKELSGAASPHTSLPTAASDGFFRWVIATNRRKEMRDRPAPQAVFPIRVARDRCQTAIPVTTAAAP